MSNGEPFNQHTVPATYLKNFASVILPKRKSRIWVLDKITGGLAEKKVRK